MGEGPGSLMVEWSGGVPPVQATDLELLAVLASGVTGPIPAGDVSRNLLGEFGSLVAVLRESPSSLERVHGVGRSLAARIRAAREIGRRFARQERISPRLHIAGPEDVAQLLLDEMKALDREHFRAILLNTKNRILGIRTISIGSLNSSVVHAREVFKAAVTESAQAIVLVHNHPSGVPDPSPEDLAVTDRLVHAGRILGIEVLDHVILGSRDYVSLKELGHI